MRGIDLEIFIVVRGMSADIHNALGPVFLVIGEIRLNDFGLLNVKLAGQQIPPSAFNAGNSKTGNPGAVASPRQ